MSYPIERRKFLHGMTAVSLAAAVTGGRQTTSAQEPTDAADSPGDNELPRVVLGVMGLNRGRSLAQTFAGLPQVEIRYVCDADQERIAACVKDLESGGGSPPTGVTDFRRILDDPEVNALVCAAPNHWHGPATILACQAGKHVYVEKPCSHNPWEGEAMVAVAHRQQRVVQLGTQRRSSPGTQLAIARLHAGAIGKPYLAHAVYFSARGSIGVGKPAAVPGRLDYELWQGPAPRQPYVDNLVHYNWHWRWHWGNGELGNNGIHTLDLCRWGLNVTYPNRVTSSGGRYAYQDDQQTPDTQTVAFEFPEGQAITWQGLSCNGHGTGFVAFYGTEGTLELQENGNFRVFNRRDELQEEHQGSTSGGLEHAANFLLAVRAQDRAKLNAEITEGHRSTLLCHLGNIAQRAGVVLNCDPATGQIRDNDLAQAHWRRDYAPGWEPQV